jgi:hypothetical protein
MEIDDERDVLAHVTDRTWVQRLMQHQSPTIYEGGSYYYTGALPAGMTKRTLRGVTRIMKDELWEARSPPQRRRTPTKTGTPRPRGQKALYGAMRGSLIHRQLQEAIQLDRASFLRRHPEGTHPWLAPLVEALLARGWRPVRSEFVTCDPALDMATQIDLVCVDRAGRLILIELKTGYADGAFTTVVDGAWRKGSVPARYGWQCTPFARAVCQDMLGALAVARELDLPDGAYVPVVAHVDGRTVTLTEVGHDVLAQVGCALYADTMLKEQGRRRARRARK